MMSKFARSQALLSEATMRKTNLSFSLRAQAAITLLGNAKVYYQEKNVHHAAEYYYRLGLDIIDKSPPPDDCHKQNHCFSGRLKDFHGGTRRSRSSQNYTLQSNLNMMMNGEETFCSRKTEYGISLATSTARANLGCFGEAGPLAPAIQSCFCKKSAEHQCGVDSLSKCGRCKLAFYCSSECQHQAWSEGRPAQGSKLVGRKKGQIKVGNDVLLGGLVFLV